MASESKLTSAPNAKGNSQWGGSGCAIRRRKQKRTRIAHRVRRGPDDYAFGEADARRIVLQSRPLARAENGALQVGLQFAPDETRAAHTAIKLTSLVVG